eukprot:363283-Chlamydomonas_euryale.AAC.11
MLRTAVFCFHHAQKQGCDLRWQLGAVSRRSEPEQRWQPRHADGGIAGRHRGHDAEAGAVATHYCLD